MEKKAILSLLFILYVSSAAGTSLIDNLMPHTLLIPDVEHWVEDFWNFIESGHTIISKFSENTMGGCFNERRYVNAITLELVERMVQLPKQMAVVENSKTYRNDVFWELSGAMSGIDNIYEDLLSRIDETQGRNFVARDLCGFAYLQLYTDPITEKVLNLYNKLEDSEVQFPSFLSGGSENYEETDCGSGHSAIDDIRSIHVSLILVEMKAFALAAFSHSILFNYNGTGNQCEYVGTSPHSAMTSIQQHLTKRLRKYNQIFLKRMDHITREFRACDQGEDFERDVTYLELEGAIQIIVHYPPNLTKSHANEVTSCEAINSEGTPKLYCNKKQQFCTTPVVRNCYGLNHNCRSLPWLVGCIAKQSPRRYIYGLWDDNVNIDITPVYPMSTIFSICTGKEVTFVVKESCMCECNDNHVDSISTHIFNLQWVESDVSENMVVTGVRFIVRHRVMQLQIQQGKLDTHFRAIDPKWKPINDISEKIRAARLNENFRGEPPGVVENEDFLVIKPGINNAINFDTLMAPHSHALTGVRFKLSDNREETPGRIQIALSSREFDHQSGELCLNCLRHTAESSIIHPNEYEYPKENIHSPILPTTPKTSNNQYTLISMSDRLRDMGQTTLPLFDALPLVSNPPAPLGGIGIFHKGNGNFTGFISLKLLSLDYSAYMKGMNL